MASEVEEQKGNLTDYANCLCSRDGGMSGSQAPTVVYQAPKNVTPGKIVRDPASVSAVQRMLNGQQADGSRLEGGHTPASPVKEDGQWRTSTSTAFYRRMLEIQEKNGITPNGQYNEETSAAMRNNGMREAADALDKMKREGTLDRIYNHRLAKVICDGADAAKPQTIVDGSAPQNIDSQPRGMVSAGSDVTARTQDVMKGIQRALGMSGDVNNPATVTEMADVMKTKIEAAQARAGLPKTGEYDPKTAEAMRQDPQTKDLAAAMDAANKLRDELNGKTVSVDPQSRTYRLDQAPSKPQTLRLDQGEGRGMTIRTDFVTAGGIQSNVNLSRSFRAADANPGPFALDNRPQPQVDQDIFVASSQILRTQQNNM